MLSIERVSKRYEQSSPLAVDELSLGVNQGEIFGFLGPNGAGKTTTIKMIVGLLRPDSGTIKIGGTNAWSEPLAAKRRIGYVPDTPDVYDRLKGIEYLNFLGDVYEVPEQERRKRAGELLEMLDMMEAAQELVQTYSHGMRQKIALTGALLHDPPLLVLDEPMVGLDPRSAKFMKDLMRARCERGGSVFFSTHILEVAERLCDRLGIILKGRLIACGTMDELRQGEQGASLENIFLELTESPEGSPGAAQARGGSPPAGGMGGR
ncbi:MAG: ABC transporter ATP-binding protein [Firmicutes bacterium]|nr:ABC transporter ATP-binding protein [Bacillota bacterium]